MSFLTVFTMVVVLFFHQVANFFMGIYASVSARLNGTVPTAVSSVEDFVGKLVASFISWLEGAVSTVENDVKKL
jgi:hypothetical protein